MSVTGPNTGFKIAGTQDLGERYISKDYLLDVYPDLNPGRTTPGLWAWGRNDINIFGTDVTGQLGDGTIVNKSSPIQIGLLTNWKQVSAGDNHCLAVKTDGTLWAWGFNKSFGISSITGGALGDGTVVAKSSPVQIGSLTNWKQVSGGLGISAAIKTDGTLWTWGNNNAGQLGSGTITSRSSPVQVGALTNWKQVDAGAYHMAAIKTDGTLWTWGSGTSGALGDGTVVAKSSPVQIGSLTNWKQVSAGFRYTLAVKTDGTLWAWGNGDSGKLGDQTTTDKSSPVQIGLLTDWKNVQAGTGDNFNSSSAAIKTDGTLWAWGNGDSGALGDQTTTDKSSPVQVGLLTNWKQVSVGDAHMVALKTDGTIWTWGDGYEGRLGQNNTTDRSSPVQVGTLTNWKQVTAGDAHTIAILDGYI